MANKYISLKALFTAIADAIRSKTGEPKQIIADNFPEAIQNISTQDYTNEDAIVTRTIVSYTNDRVTIVGNSVFLNCMQLKSVELPNCVTLEDACFYSCTKLVNLFVPKVEIIPGTAFRNCNALGYLDFPSVTTIESEAFIDSHIETLILRRTDRLVDIYPYAFANFEASLEEGLIIVYVPASLIEQYNQRQSQNMYGGMIREFRALEDYTVDGTVDGELDESKI